MSNASDPKEEEIPAVPSKFGKRLGLAVCLALILLAALAATITFSGSDSQSAAETAPTSNPFK